MSSPIRTIYRCFLAKELQINTRFLSLQPCKFARGSRLVDMPPTSKKIKEEPTQEHNINMIIDLGEAGKLLEKQKSQVVTAKQEIFMRKDSSLPFYEKLNDSDDKFSSLMLLMKSRKDRERKRKILLEGHRIIQDAIDAGVKPHSIFFSRKESLNLLKIPQEVKVDLFKLQYKQLQLWSTLTTSPGLVGVFESPQEVELESLEGEGKQDELPLTLVCDNIREPGNLGAILRVAAGVGCRQILLTKGCVDLWEPKVLRSSAGALFRVPVIQRVSWDSLAELVHTEKANVYLADSRGHKQSSQDYCDLDFSSTSPTVLILGGETEGLSAEAKKLSSLGLHIPLAGGVDSLNVATALAVILFEMRRQKLAYTVTEISKSRM